MSNSNKNSKDNNKPTTLTLKQFNISELPSLLNVTLKWIEEHANSVIGIWDQHGELLYVSQIVEPLFGIKPDDLIGKGWRGLLADDEIKCFLNKLTNFTTKITFAIHLGYQPENRIPFECTLEKLIDPKTEGVYFITILQNMTTTEESNKKMIQSEKMSVAGQLAAGIAHEIRNPLTSLKGFLQLLQAGINQKEVYYQIMSDELDKIETITSELLFISKPLTNKRSYESVHSMINDVMVLLNSQANIHNVKIVRMETSDNYLYCDRSQIKQVLINIIKNAIEATNEQGTVTIKVEDIGQEIQIDVIDEGPGIPPEIIDKIGEPFFTTKEGGTGLGLMVTKQIIEQHHGKLEIIKNTSKGSTFRIIMPNAKKYTEKN